MKIFKKIQFSLLIFCVFLEDSPSVAGEYETRRSCAQIERLLTVENPLKEICMNVIRAQLEEDIIQMRLYSAEELWPAVEKILENRYFTTDKLRQLTCLSLESFIGRNQYLATVIAGMAQAILDKKVETHATDKV